VLVRIPLGLILYNDGNMISFIYFDLGGVVIDDFSGNTKWDELKTELGINETNVEKFQQLWSTYSPQLCTTLSTEDLLSILQQELNLVFRDNYSLLSGFVDRFEANPSILPVLEFAKQHARLGLLTNMYIGMFDAIQRLNILPGIEWDTVLDSSIEGLEKPDRRFFELATERADAQSGDILFIDNTQEHIDAARALGWNTYFYDANDHQASSAQLLEYLRKTFA